VFVLAPVFLDDGHHSLFNKGFQVVLLEIACFETQHSGDGPKLGIFFLDNLAGLATLQYQFDSLINIAIARLPLEWFAVTYVSDLECSLTIQDLSAIYFLWLFTLFFLAAEALRKNNADKANQDVDG
jgi:hypothetical protein